MVLKTWEALPSTNAIRISGVRGWGLIFKKKAPKRTLVCCEEKSTFLQWKSTGLGWGTQRPLQPRWEPACPVAPGFTCRLRNARKGDISEAQSHSENASAGSSVEPPLSEGSGRQPDETVQRSENSHLCGLHSALAFLLRDV